MNTLSQPVKRHQSATACATNSGSWSKRTNAGAPPRWAARRSSTLTTPSASIKRSTSIDNASRVNSSITLSSFKVRPSTVTSNWKSSAHSALGRIGHIAPTCAPIPRSGCLRFRVGTRRRSSRHRRRIRLSFTAQPARRAALAARRHPHLGRSVQNSRRNSRSCRSSSLIGGGSRRWVERCWPTTRQARRSDTPNRDRSISTALRRRFGVRSLPPRSP